MKKTKTYSIKEDFSMVAILTIPICVAINVVGDQIVQLLKLPIFLDVIDTVLMAMLAGPWPAAVTGILTNLCMGITDNPTLIPFAITSAACGIAAGLFARKKWFSAQKWKLIIIVLVLDLVTICTASPITIFAFGGVSGNGGQSVAIAGLLASGANIIAAVVGTDFWINLIDRALAMVIAFAVVKVIPDRTLIKYSLGANFTKKKSE
ncbi:MAG: ECF transporter S component [[Clostridium] scindens]